LEVEAEALVQGLALGVEEVEVPAQGLALGVEAEVEVPAQGLALEEAEEAEEAEEVEPPAQDLVLEDSGKENYTPSLHFFIYTYDILLWLESNSESTCKVRCRKRINIH
jgi:hypothetical protein